MNATIIKPIRLSREEVEALKKHLALSDNEEIMERFEILLTESLQVAVPKAIYRELDVEKQEGDTVTIAGTVFASKVMRSNLKEIGRVIGYVITCGTEVEDWSEQYEDDPFDRFLSDGIKQLILYAAATNVFETVKDRFELGNTATMNPGSLPDWPITEQAKLLPLIGDVKNEIGVTLTQSNLLVPIKSVSGILFPTEVGYVNCKLCTKKECPARQAPFDAEMYREKLGKAK